MDDQTLSARMLCLSIGHDFADDGDEMIEIADACWNWLVGPVRFTAEPGLVH